MENEYFVIAADASRSFLSVTMRGHWSVETVEEYRNAVIAVVSKMRQAGCRRGELLVVVDARELSAQSQEAVTDFKSRMDQDGLRPRRLATIISSALFKRQVERIGIAHQRLFTEEAEALTWLFDPGSDS